MSIIPFPSRHLPGIPLVKPLDSAAAAPRAILSDLAAILGSATPPAAEAPAAEPPAIIPPLTIIARGMKALKRLAGFIGPSQLAFVKQALRGEEGQWFMEKMEELAAIIQGMPVTYGQNGKGDDAICYLHYFGPSYDMWITEKDIEEPADPAEAQWQAHGYTHWAQNGDHISMGYICLPEILAAGAELDFHFSPCTVREIKQKVTGASCSSPSPDHPDPEPDPPAPKSTGIFGGWELLSEQIPQGVILFVQLGDFHETFAHHAKLAAPLLNVALTKRNGVPMCGIPVHAADSYIKRLLEAGHAVMLATFDKDSGKAHVQRTLTPPACQAPTGEDMKPPATDPPTDPIAERQKEFLAMPDGYQPGAIIYCSWGYDQTNINFYRIEKRSGAFVTLIPLRQRDRTETGFMSGTTMPSDTPKDYAKDHDPAWSNKDPQNPKPSFRRKLSIREGHINGLNVFGCGWASLWEGKPMNWTSYA
jgi:hypothetical protein